MRRPFYFANRNELFLLVLFLLRFTGFVQLRKKSRWKSSKMRSSVWRYCGYMERILLNGAIKAKRAKSGNKKRTPKKPVNTVLFEVARSK